MTARSKPSLLEFLSTAIKGNDTDNQFENLKAAETYIIKDYSPSGRMSAGPGIVEYDYDEGTKTLVNIKGIYIKGQFIPVAEFDQTACETAHIKKIHSALSTSYNFHLKAPYLHYLSKIPQDLWCFLLIDVEFLIQKFETYRNYDSREPGCVKDLFDTLSLVIGSLSDSSPLTINHVINLQKSLSQALFKNEKESRSGALRNCFSGFPMSANNLTVQGIVEILGRIKKDNNDNGFVIAPLQNLNIMSGYFKILATTYENLYFFGQGVKGREPPNNDHEKDFCEHFKIISQQAIDAIGNQLQTEKGLEKKQVVEVIQEVLATFETEKNLKAAEIEFNKSSRVLFWNIARTRFYSHAKADLVKSEHNLAMDYSRNHPLAFNAKTLASCDSTELDAKAKDIYDLIKNDSKDFFFFAPEISLAIELARQAITRYNQEVSSINSLDDFLYAVIKLVHELEILHIFHDVNCRTTYGILNLELLKHGFMPTVLYNPNRLDLYSIDELVQEVKLGMMRFQYLINDVDGLSKINQSNFLYDYRWAVCSKYDTDYQSPEITTINKMYTHISASLLNKVNDFNTTYEKIISCIEFFLIVNDFDSKSYFDLLFSELKKTNDLVSFCHEIDQWDTVDFSFAEFKSIVSELKLLVPYEQYCKSRTIGIFATVESMSDEFNRLWTLRATLKDIKTDPASIREKQITSLLTELQMKVVDRIKSDFATDSLKLQSFRQLPIITNPVNLTPLSVCSFNPRTEVDALITAIPQSHSQASSQNR